MAFYKVALNTILFRLVEQLDVWSALLQRIQGSGVVATHKSCLTPCLKDMPAVGNGERLSCMVLSRKRLSLSKTVTQEPCCHQAQDTHPTKVPKYGKWIWSNEVL